MPKGIYKHNLLSEETKKKISQSVSKSLMGHIVSEETKKKLSEINRGKHLSPETEFKKGHKDIVSKESRILAGIKNRVSQKGKHNNKGKNNPFYGKTFSEKAKYESSESHKRLWKNSETAKLILEKFYNSLKKRPTSYEKKISDLCIEYNLPFIYTGDGKFLIGYKNPDFINEKNKIVIEIYHTYFKIRDFGSCEEYERQRSEYFARYGWKSVFIRTEDIENKDWKEVCLNKLKEFKK